MVVSFALPPSALCGIDWPPIFLHQSMTMLPVKRPFLLHHSKPVLSSKSDPASHRLAVLWNPFRHCATAFDL